MVCNVSAFLCLNANSDRVYVSSSFNFTILFLGGDELGKVDLFNYYLLFVIVCTVGDLPTTTTTTKNKITQTPS